MPPLANSSLPPLPTVVPLATPPFKTARVPPLSTVVPSTVNPLVTDSTTPLDRMVLTAASSVPPCPSAARTKTSLL